MKDKILYEFILTQIASQMTPDARFQRLIAKLLKLHFFPFLSENIHTKKKMYDSIFRFLAVSMYFL